MAWDTKFSRATEFSIRVGCYNETISEENVVL